MNMYTHNTNCRICGSSDLVKVIDLGNQPLANSFVKNSDGFKDEKKFPLAVYFCQQCNLAQLCDVVDKNVLYDDYVYFTSGIISILMTSGLSKDNHFYLYAQDIIEKFLKKDDFVVEIASNDGAMLQVFKNNGNRILGIDPAKNVAAVANKNGIETWIEFFDDKVAENITRKHGKAKAIIANNVVAHIDNHHGLARGVKELLATDGVFVFEAPYLVDMFHNLTYDTVYHEHLSFLSIRPLKKLFEQFGLELFDVEIKPIQGKSLRGFVCHTGAYPVSQRVDQLIKEELALGLHKLDTYHELARRIEEQKKKVVDILKEIKRQGKSIAAYGAPAKGNTMLNYCQIGADILDYALDDLALKQNLYTPGMHIPVKDRAYASSNPPDYFLMLAWNYADAIIKKEQAFIDNGGKFIIPVEGVKII